MFKFENRLVENYQVDSFLEQEIKKYNFRILALINAGKVYDLLTKNHVAEGCFPILYDHSSGLIFSHANLDDQYKHFESTDLSIKSPFAGTWCVDKRGALSKFINNSHLSIPNEYLSYFFNSYLFYRSYLADNEFIKGFLTTGIKSYEHSQISDNDTLQLTIKPKGDVAIDPYADALKKLYKIQNRRVEMAPKPKAYIPPVRELKSVEVVLDYDIHYDLSKKDGFHVVSNGKRKVVIQGGPTCNPSACINALTYIEPKKLTDKTIEDLYQKLIGFNYRTIKTVRGVEIEGSKATEVNFVFDDDAGFETGKVTGALNQIAKEHEVLGKYRFEQRLIKDPTVKTNPQIASVLLKEFEANRGRPMIISTSIYKEGREYEGHGHALTLEGIKKVDGEIWMDLFDSNGRSFTVKAGSDMRMETLYQARSSGSEIRMNASPIHEFDLGPDYVLIQVN